MTNEVEAFRRDSELQLCLNIYASFYEFLSRGVEVIERAGKRARGCCSLHCAHSAIKQSPHFVNFHIKSLSTRSVDLLDCRLNLFSENNFVEEQNENIS